jgi:citronellol/citronellal dehydrogenase
MNVVITGGSRGIGRAIALRLAREGANIAILAKTATPHPKLEGTIYTVADEINAAGGKAFPFAVDIREEDTLQSAIQTAAENMGGIDILINNASAIQLLGTEALNVKQYDLMMDINVRGSFLATKYCLPYLKNSTNAHIITLSPPLNLNPRWFEHHTAYTLSKYSMSLLTIGWAAEYADAGIRANTLWPKTLIATAAIMNMPGGEDMCRHTRKPEIMADAVMAILNDPESFSGQHLIDEDVLSRTGVTDFNTYSMVAGAELIPDLFL